MERRWARRGMQVQEVPIGKFVFMEHNMLIDVDMPSKRVKTLIGFIMWGITNEDTVHFWCMVLN